MNKICIFSLLAFALVASQQTYQLVWNDEFDGNALDQSKWGYEVNCDGGGNNELQCYTANPDNLKVNNGFLTITAKPQNYNGKQYTSARINTKGKAAWKYGKFSTRAKMPNGAYLWPALWMMPRDSVYGGWAASGEIDIFEGRGQNLNEYQSTLHYGGSWPNNVYQGSGERKANFDLSADFHVYTCTWTPDQISFDIDGNTYYTRNLNQNFWSGRGGNPYNSNRQPFDQYFFFIINVAIGGGFFGNNANALNPQMAQGWANPNMVVDYVRAYQLASGPVNPVPVPVPSVPNSAGVSVGVSTAASSAQTSAVSTAATSAVSSAASSAQTTFLYSKASPGSSAAPPATSSDSGNSDACPKGCGAGNCCADAVLGGVCYNVATHQCVKDANSKSHLCATGNGWCASSGCYQLSQYKCVGGNLSPN